MKNILIKNKFTAIEVLFFITFSMFYYALRENGLTFVQALPAVILFVSIYYAVRFLSYKLGRESNNG